MDSVLGKFIFVLTPEAREEYYDLHPNLEDALAFTSGYPVDTLNDTSLLFLQMADGSLNGARGPPYDQAYTYDSWPKEVRKHDCLLVSSKDTWSSECEHAVTI